MIVGERLLEFKIGEHKLEDQAIISCLYQPNLTRLRLVSDRLNPGYGRWSYPLSITRLDPGSLSRVDGKPGEGET
jgi:hypothetical protein